MELLLLIFLRNLYTDFHSGAPATYPPIVQKSSFFPIAPPAFVTSCFLDDTHSFWGVMESVFLMCISQMTNDTENFFICLFVVCISASEKCLFILDAHFGIRSLNLGGLTFLSSFYVLKNNPFSDAHVANLFTLTVHCLFTLLVVSLVQKLFNKMSSQLFFVVVPLQL